VRESPYVACLQELKASERAFPIEAIREAGYGATWHGQRSWNGVATLAKGVDPIERRRGLPGDPDDTHSRRGRSWRAARRSPPQHGCSFRRPSPASRNCLGLYKGKARLDR